MNYRVALAAALLGIGLTQTQTAFGQEHGQVGMFANYFRFSDLNHHNFAGLGGRLSLSLSPNAQIEGEMAYDFEQVFIESYANPVTGSITFQRSPLRILHGLFGPKFHTGAGPLRAFFVLKGGFLNFRFDSRPATFGTFLSSVEELRSSDVRGVFYPGGGVEGYLGPVGLRLEFGDEIYFQDGAHHNLRITFGPTIRF